ncbi:MAG: hypothetical protein MK116_04700 [Phycisphaerales bacterium]|nr:hypothetical protein [Phycisphaerales bacterium]
MNNITSPTGAVVATTLTAILTCTTTGLAADGPATFEGNQLPLDAVGTLTVAGPDYQRLWAEDAQLDGKGQAMRFAVSRDVSVTPMTHGTWELMPDGRMLWRLVVHAKGSKHINFAFEDWGLPDSATAWIASLDGRWVLQPVTSADNINDGELWTAIVASDSALIEIAVDDADRQALIDATTLTRVNVGYRGFGNDGARGSSEGCNHDVECPLGDDWWNEIPSAGVYTINGGLTCSGAMINNTNQDETPYFITAEHCGISSGNDQSVVVYWNHQNSYCRTPGSGDSGGNGNGNYNQYTSGSTFLVESSTTDYTLIRLNSSPNPSYEVTFSGWSRSSSTPCAGVSIHHPNCAEKRISSVQNVSSNGQYWRINWSEGRTYFGSSGSPLYNCNHQIVGVLCCGNSFCTNDDDDFYGKSLYQSWSQMAQYLDPNGSGVVSLDTLNPYGDGGNGGVCCLNGECFNVPEGNCGSAGGTWFTGQNCSGVDCSNIEPTGACCLTSGACTGDVTNSACTNAGGSYQGDNSDCANVTCEQPDPTGACCLAGGNCATQTSEDCAAAGGSYQGNNTSCSNVDCDAADIVEVVHAIVGSGKVSGDTPNWTVDVYAAVDPGFRVDAVAGNSTQQKMITSTYGFYQDPYGGPTSTSINPAFFEFAPNMEWDSRVTIGAIDDSGNPYDENVLQSVGINWDLFESGGDLSVGDGTWFILPDDGQGETRTFTGQDCTQRQGVLLARLTAMELDSTVMFEALVQGRDSGGNTWQDVVSYTFNYEATEDCNDNLVPDSCDIANGTSDDSNGNGIPDECDNSCPGDADGDGDSDVDDILACIAGFGTAGPGDVNGDGGVDVNDLLQILAYFDNC